jgi:hypothetical protein
VGNCRRVKRGTIFAMIGNDSSDLPIARVPPSSSVGIVRTNEAGFSSAYFTTARYAWRALRQDLFQGDGLERCKVVEKLPNHVHILRSDRLEGCLPNGAFLSGAAAVPLFKLH